MTDREKPEAAATIVAIGGLENSACFCQFADGEVTIPEWVELFNTVPGYNWDAKEMMRAGRRVYYLKRLINYRFGRTAEDDKLTKRMLEPARDGEPEGIEINFDGMKKNFYEIMKIDPVKAIPVKEALEEYGMSEEATVVW